MKVAFTGKPRFQDVIERAATKGRITEEGVKVLEAGLPTVLTRHWAPH